MTHTTHGRRTAIVTGAARGIGAAVATRFVVSDTTRASTRRLGRDFEGFRRSAAKAIPVGRPVGRVGEPEDIAHTASFLVSREAGFLSGQVIYVAGGPVDRG